MNQSKWEERAVAKIYNCAAAYVQEKKSLFDIRLSLYHSVLLVIF